MKKTGVEKIAAESMDNFKPYAIAGTAALGLFLLSLTGLRYTPW